MAIGRLCFFALVWQRPFGHSVPFEDDPFDNDEATLLQLDVKRVQQVNESPCKAPFSYKKQDNDKICYRDWQWRDYLTGYWGQDNCVCGDQICETELGAALAATPEPYRSAWEGNCVVTQCPWVLPGRLGNPMMTICTDPRRSPMIAELDTIWRDVAGYGFCDRSYDPPMDASMDQVYSYLAQIEPPYATLLTRMAVGCSTTIGNVGPEQPLEVDGAAFTLTKFAPNGATASDPLPCVLHMHGGGMAILSSANQLYKRWRRLLASHGLIVIAVEFRNSAGAAGNNPFPDALNDCVAALKWVHERRAQLGISQIILSGESGGGNLAIATALQAKRDGNIAQADGVYAQCPWIAGPEVWTARSFGSLEENHEYFGSDAFGSYMWRAYDPEGAHTRNPLAWPLFATRDDLIGLPPHVISVNELDALRDEGLEFARKLRDAGVSVYSKVLQGASHASGIMPMDSNLYLVQSSAREVYAFAQSLR